MLKDNVQMLIQESKHTSIWCDATKTTHYPSLFENLHVDVVIIGGGIGGLSSAYMLKKAGKKVAVLEAERIVEGVTGFTTAHITSEHNFMYDSLINDHGEEKARLYAQANESAIQQIEDIVNQEQIDCDFKRVSQYFFSENEQDLHDLKKEYEATQKVGLPTTYEESAPVPFKTYGAIHYQNQAQFHPRKYLLAVAGKIHGDGSYIFEHTRVLGVDESEPCIVKTDKGEIKANDVIVATHYPILDRGGFFARLKPERSYVIGLYVEDEFPQHMFDNTDDPYYYIRTQPTEKGTLVLIGGQDHMTGQDPDTESKYKNLEEYAHSHFKVKSIEYYWSTQDTYPFDNLPFIGRYTPTSKHLYVATGFQGYGMTHGTISGMLLTDMILGKKNDWAEVYTPQRVNLKAEGPTMLKEGLNIAKTLITGKLSDGAKQTIEELQLGRGKVLEVDDQKVAVYKDTDGTVYKLSASCTHMGCIVSFNQAEKSWDCPCHGSRFGVHGNVLHGPAIKPLEHYKED